MKKYFALLGALLLAFGSASYSHAEQAPQAMSTQLTNVSGIVTDENGEPVIGATVSEIGTTRATATDINGRFNLRASGNGKIQISYVGYKTVTVNPGTNINVKLTEDNALLDEVVVVGYGQQKKVNLTGAVSVISTFGFVAVEAVNTRPAGMSGSLLWEKMKNKAMAAATADNGNSQRRRRLPAGFLSVSASCSIANRPSTSSGCS